MFPEFRAGDVNAHGWRVGPGPVAMDCSDRHDGSVALPTGGAESTGTASVDPTELSDDGRTIAGTAYDGSETMRAVMWR